MDDFLIGFKVLQFSQLLPSIPGTIYLGILLPPRY